MPDLDANRRLWDRDYPWPQGGEEWSAAWGGADAQWHSTLRPRLRHFLPAPTILEIATGHGRWTKYLVECCERYVGVDLSPRAVESCRRQFEHIAHAEFHVTDGRSLAMVEDASIVLAFSFDSLVHVEDDVIGGYLHELARVLVPDGVAFLHHSNLAACRPVPRPMRLALRIGERTLGRHSPGFDQLRGTTMSAERLVGLADQAGLACIGQEVVNWLGGRLIDCISLVTPRGSDKERPNVVVENPYLMSEAASSARAAGVYGNAGVPPTAPAAAGASQHLGSLGRIASMTVGPWGLSIVGPWAKRRR